MTIFQLLAELTKHAKEEERVLLNLRELIHI